METSAFASPAASARTSAVVTNGMSHATQTTGAGATCTAVRIPPSEPSPGRISALTRRPGCQPAAAGSLATRSGGSPSASVKVRTRRSRIRSPPTTSRPLGRPPKRVAPPPARTAPRTPLIAAAAPALEHDVEADVHADEVLDPGRDGGEDPVERRGAGDGPDRRDVVAQLPPDLVAFAHRGGEADREHPRRAHSRVPVVRVDDRIGQLARVGDAGELADRPDGALGGEEEAGRHADVGR